MYRLSFLLLVFCIHTSYSQSEEFNTKHTSYTSNTGEKIEYDFFIENQDSILHGEYKRYINDTLIESSHYWCGLLHGKSTLYYDGEGYNGNLKRESSYVYGIPDGLFIDYDHEVNGRPVSKTNYHCGMKKVELSYSDDGKLIRTNEYYNGTRIYDYSSESKKLINGSLRNYYKVFIYIQKFKNLKETKFKNKIVWKKGDKPLLEVGMNPENDLVSGEFKLYKFDGTLFIQGTYEDNFESGTWEIIDGKGNKISIELSSSPSDKIMLFNPVISIKLFNHSELYEEYTYLHSGEYFLLEDFISIDDLTEYLNGNRELFSTSQPYIETNKKLFRDVLVDYKSYKNGQKSSMGKFLDRCKYSEWTTYSPDGEIISKGVYSPASNEQDNDFWSKDAIDKKYGYWYENGDDVFYVGMTNEEQSQSKDEGVPIENENH